MPGGASDASAPEGTRAGGLTALRAHARAIFDAAVAAGHAGTLVRRALALEGERFRVGEHVIDLGPVRRILVVGMGKASGAMAAAVEELLGDRVADGRVAVRDLDGTAPRRVRLLPAGHPIPDARGVAAAEAIHALVSGASADDLVLCLVSGGGSALAPLPVPGLSLEDKQVLTGLLLRAGATIGELNTVRKHLSRLKGGQLARAAAPARVVALLLSDVIGDPPDVIASGPTAPDPTTFADALAVLERLGVGDRVPASARTYLLAGARGEVPETPKPGDPLFERVTNVVVGNNQVVVEAAAAEARRRGFAPLVLTRSLQGEAREVARAFVAVLEEVRRSGRPAAPPACLLAAGETTVTVRGPGLGGRCQEFCLATVPSLAALPATVVLAAGTDGCDGPTAAAGAVVDTATLRRARAAGLDPGAALAANDSHGFFAQLGDLVVTGPTGTNLLDLYLGLVGVPCSA